MKNILNYLLVCCFTLFSLSLTAQQVPDGTVVYLQNSGTGEFLTAAASGSNATMSASAGSEATQWTFELNANGLHNIDSQIPSGTSGRGILRALGSGSVISTNISPPRNDADKSWTIEYDAATDTYRFLQAQGTNRYLYDNPSGSVTATNVPATDLNSVWKAVPLFSPPPIPNGTVVTLQNSGTGEFLTAAASGSNVTMSASAGTLALATHWTFELNANGLHNIDSQLPSTTSGRGILRALGSGSVISTNLAPPRTDNDKSWTIEYNVINDTYRFRQGTNRYLYDNPSGSVTATNVPATDLNSVWKAAPPIPPTADIPTMGEWGIFILFLLMITVTIIVQMSPKMATSNGQTVHTGINFKELPFDKITFLKAWALTTVFAIVVFAIAMNFFGYELTSADPTGSIITSALIAYMFMLLKNYR